MIGIDSVLLLDDHKMLSRHLLGKYITRLLRLTENSVSLLLNDGTVVDFMQLEDELLVDVIPPR